MDRENVIKGLEETEIMLKQAVDSGGEMSIMGALKCLHNVTDTLVLLKEQKAKRTCDNCKWWKEKEWICNCPTGKNNGYETGPLDICDSFNCDVEARNATPTIDAVPVVRCKDCKHFDCSRLYKCRIHGSLFQPKDKNWFCADGERKEGGEVE